MLIKVSEASGPALDWMVGMVLWGEVRISTFGPLFGKGFKAPCWNGNATLFKPSTDGRTGSLIIEKYKIGSHWEPMKSEWSAMNGMAYGATQLIAAMRYFVASNLGDEVHVPDELL